MSSDRPPVAAGWNVDLFRLTAFPAPQSPAPLIERWWQELVGEPPEQIIKEPKKGEVQLQGRSNNTFLIMTSQIMRVELRQAVNPPGPPIGPYDDVRPDFHQLGLKWLECEDCPPLQRLAFGAILTKPVGAELENGYAVLRPYLPGVEIPESSSDFLYQINRRRSSNTVNNLSINRLSKWSVQMAQEVIVTGDGIAVRREYHLSCRVELDINSAPEHTRELPADALPALFDELVTLANEISTAGDIP